ncbi:MAG: hypothetical protein M1586_01675 [Patescibacteria group bacterium]|nr:hypothetical protein [Patescibacteria group bacterium]MCL5261993.1 hypothetical protein [Patescibacteria group bacterium]
MPKNSTILLIVLLVIVATGITFFVLDSFKIKLPDLKTPVPTTTTVPIFSSSGQKLVATYSPYLIEGPIKNIAGEKLPTKITIAIKLASIFVNPKTESVDVTCDLEKDAVIAAFDPATNKEKSIVFADLKVNDQVVADLTVNNNLSILEGASCLIHKIRFMIPTPSLPAR